MCLDSQTHRQHDGREHRRLAQIARTQTHGNLRLPLAVKHPAGGGIELALRCENGVFELLGDAGLDDSLSLNLNLLAGRWVPTHSGRTMLLY